MSADMEQCQPGDNQTCFDSLMKQKHIIDFYPAKLCKRTSEKDKKLITIVEVVLTCL